jgi:hypothetical protein
MEQDFSFWMPEMERPLIFIPLPLPTIPADESGKSEPQATIALNAGIWRFPARGRAHRLQDLASNYASIAIRSALEACDGA